MTGAADVYVDLFFLINFSMDYLCFYVTLRILHRRIPLFRVLLASGIGGLYAVLALLWERGLVPDLVCDLGVCFGMGLLVFGRRGGRAGEILRMTLLYIGVSMAVGGCMTGLYSLLNRLRLPLDGIGSDGVSVWLFLLLAAGSAFMALIGGRDARRSAATGRARIEIAYAGCVIRAEALVDTGNVLRDPVSGRPAVVVDLDRVRLMLPQRALDELRAGNATAAYLSMAGRGTCLLPTATATGGGLLLGIRPDRLTVSDAHGSHDAEALIVPSVLGAGADGCAALLPVELVS